MIRANWQDHFHSHIKSAENLYSKDSTSVSLLMFCLRSKILPSETYLDWAKENYQLPVLSQKYFESHPPQKEFYQKWQNLFPWSVECLPVAEWDGSLIVACLEIPKKFPNSIPSIFVLTSSEVLDHTWSAYNHSASVAVDSGVADMTSLAATIVAPSVEQNAFFSETGEVILQDENSEDEATEESDNKTSGDEEENTEIPEGLLGDSTAKLESLGAFTKTNSEVFHPMNTENTEEIKTSDIKAKESPSEANPVTKKGPRSTQPLTPTKPDSADKNHGVKKFTALTGPDASTGYVLEKIRKINTDQFDKEAVASFQQMKTFFKKSMLLAVDHKKNLIKPILWDDNFEVQNPQNLEFDLKSPSIFRIVTSTQKSYHGWIILNDLNESFFESWNHGQIPDHVTLVPLIEGDLLVGILMGLGEKACYNKNVLQFTENIARSLALRILKAKSAIAA